MKHHLRLVPKLAPVISLADRRQRMRAVLLAGELRRKHVHLDILLEALVKAFRDGSWGDVLEEWRYLEPALRVQMAREDREFLPRFREQHPDEATVLLAQHDALRRMLDLVAVGIGLHSVSRGELESFVTLLRGHAAREERLFHPWLDDEAAGAKTMTPVNRSPSLCPGA